MQLAWAEVYQSFRPMATCGSLPCIKELQDAGFDVQVRDCWGAGGWQGCWLAPGSCAKGSSLPLCGAQLQLAGCAASADRRPAAGAPQMMGFGAMDVYHANNEYCSLAAFGKGMRLLAKLVQVLE
jgi:hypothetical protein